MRKLPPWLTIDLHAPFVGVPVKLRRCEGGPVDSRGECLACPSDAGEACNIHLIPTTTQEGE